MHLLNWSPAKAHDAQFIGQCLRDTERPRLERFTGQPSHLAFVGVHNGALGSAVLRIGGQPIAMLCGNPCSMLGLRTAFLALTPHAERVHDLDDQALREARKHAQGDALGMVAMTEQGDGAQARWLPALGFQKAPPAWTAGMSVSLFYVVCPGAELLIREFLDSLATGFDVLATRH